MPSTEPPPSAADGHRPLVLVVDDDPLMNLYAAERLADGGFDVETVEDGPSALDAVQGRHPDLVILDVQMPGMDGFETCRRIRQADQGRHTPILMLTGLDDLASIKKAYEAGATDFATKPANWTILAHRIEYMLRSARSASDLRSSRARLANAQRIAQLGYWEWDIVSGEVLVSSQMRQILGLADDEPLDSIGSLLRRTHPQDRERVRQELYELVEDEQSREVQFRLRLAEDEERYLRQRTELAVDGSHGTKRITGVVLDITGQQRAEDRAHFLASYDLLTELPNRRSFADQLDISLAAADRHDRQVAVLLLDLDRFNRINDTLGRGAGDRALVEVAHRLRTQVRRSDSVGRPGGDLLARLGGDEFAVLLTELKDDREVATVARRLAAAVSRPFLVDSHQVVLTASMGISVFPADGTDSETLLANAEAALYNARARGGDSYRFYSADLNADAVERLALETDLSGALDRAELRLEYQPLFEAASGGIIGAEALIRWHHPQRGRVAPGEFIPMAEQTGAIFAIGEWVLRTACESAVRWQRSDLGELSVSVNLSARQLECADFASTVEAVLADTGLEPHLLNLELTESFLLEDVDRAALALEKLKELGVRLSLDDFGTGYSSLSYLMRLPLDTIKIDRSFLNGTPGEPLNRAITTAIIGLARGVGMEVVAEGVETDEQLEYLRLQGCDTLQGFLLSRPLPAEELEGVLNLPATRQRKSSDASPTTFSATAKSGTGAGSLASSGGNA